MPRPYLIEPIRWDVLYPLHAEPIGQIRRRGGAFHSTLAGVPIGSFPTGDRAAEAIWEGYLAANRSRHAAASVIHGSTDRHPSSQPSARRPR